VKPTSFSARRHIGNGSTTRLTPCVPLLFWLATPVYCRGEMLHLMKDCVNFYADPVEGDLYGSLVIKRGLKRRARKRTLQIDGAMKAVLDSLLSLSECDHVFTHPGDPTQPLGAWVLETQMGTLRTRIKTHPDAGLHGLRHTFLTEAGEHTDPFTLQYTAGHDTIRTTMRYVHPQANAVHTLLPVWLLCEAESICPTVRCKRS